MGDAMFGIEDLWVGAAFLLCILSTLLCIVWGVLKWNLDDSECESEEEIRQWAEEEDRVEEEL